MPAGISLSRSSSAVRSAKYCSIIGSRIGAVGDAALVGGEARVGQPVGRSSAVQKTRQKGSLVPATKTDSVLVGNTRKGQRIAN